jgi:hypothetical protein
MVVPLKSRRLIGSISTFWMADQSPKKSACNESWNKRTITPNDMSSELSGRRFETKDDAAARDDGISQEAKVESTTSNESCREIPGVCFELKTTTDLSGGLQVPGFWNSAKPSKQQIKEMRVANIGSNSMVREEIMDHSETQEVQDAVGDGF